MTLCKYMKPRSYCARYVIEQDDVPGLMKALRTAAGDAARDGLWTCNHYVGALIAFETMFSFAAFNGEVDKWTDFIALFDAALRELEGDE